MVAVAGVTGAMDAATVEEKLVRDLRRLLSPAVPDDAIIDADLEAVHKTTGKRGAGVPGCETDGPA